MSEQVAQHKLRIASLYETSLNDLERSGRVYREVLTRRRNIVALRWSRAHLESLHDCPYLVQILERQLDVVETERERVEVLIKLAHIQEDHLP